MSDFEKNRAEYVTHLEAQNTNLQQQLAAIKAEERWIPKVSAVMEDGKARVTLSFGGKNQTGSMPIEYICGQSSGDATINILDLAFKDMVFDRLREVIEPEVLRIQTSARAVANAGKW
jgi:hypothetical protein